MSLLPSKTAGLSAAWIAETYGGLVPIKDLSRLLGFNSAAAIRRASATGRLNLPIFRPAGRRGFFAHAVDVSAYLKAQEDLARQGGDSKMT